MPAKSADSDDKRSALPGGGSVLLQNVTKVAAIATRSIAVQNGGPSLRTACGIVSRPRQSLPQPTKRWMMRDRCTSGAQSRRQHWVELHNVQHSIQSTLDKRRDPGRTPSAHSPTVMLEQMKERIHNIAQDMQILNRSCGEELVRSSRGAERNGRV